MITSPLPQSITTNHSQSPPCHHQNRNSHTISPPLPSTVHNNPSNQTTINPPLPLSITTATIAVHSFLSSDLHGLKIQIPKPYFHLQSKTASSPTHLQTYLQTTQTNLLCTRPIHQSPCPTRAKTKDHQTRAISSPSCQIVLLPLQERKKRKMQIRTE
jgi:hypothetical protein